MEYFSARLRCTNRRVGWEYSATTAAPSPHLYLPAFAAHHRREDIPMIRTCQIALLLALLVGHAFAATCGPDTCPQYDAKLNLVQNIRVFRNAGMPPIGLCSRIESNVHRKPFRLNRAEQSEIGYFLDPGDLQGAECLSRFLWQSSNIGHDRELTRKLSALVSAFAFEARQNPYKSRYRPEIGWAVPKGLFVCLLLDDLLRPPGSLRCERLIEYFDDERDRLPHVRDIAD